eukprot:CAMPEP_0185158380 /NCGR_PEP_ID=MMETSP1139-20130426/2382_1 /TAXON_ID=298111 /ORGANISM="Pavlova sp., Strain CCMP459" /LENGTH=32 /DNA_ID= /DNA_START= /DNA_END= /DNA_ORIENTATION=
MTTLPILPSISPMWATSVATSCWRMHMTSSQR